MLKILRNKKIKRRIYIALALIVIPLFVLSGYLVRARDKSGGPSYAGRVFGRDVSLLDYKDSLDAVRIQAIMQFGDKFPQVEKYLNLEDQAWIRIILLAEAKKRKIFASDQEVIETIESYPFFQRQGAFDNRIYNDILRYEFRIQPRAFEEETRQNIIVSKLYGRLTGNIKVTEDEVRSEYEKANESFNLYYIAALFKDFEKAVVINNQEIQGYYDNHKLDFKQPLSFNLEYICADAEGKIRSLLPHLNKKEYLDNLIKGLGIEKKETGFFSETQSIPGLGWSTQIIGIISKLKAGEYIGPLQIDKKFYLFKLIERQEPFVPDLDKIKEEVKAACIKNKALELAKAKMDECLKKIKQDYPQETVDFSKLSAKFGLKSGETGIFKYASYIEGIGSSDIFWMNAKSLKEGQISPVLSGGTGFYIVKLKSRLTIEEKKFKEEQADFAKRFLMQKKQDSFANFLEDLKTKAQRF